MNDIVPTFGEQYARALREHLAGGSETTLHAAYEIGRSALAAGLGILDMAALHNAAFLAAWRESGGDGPDGRGRERGAQALRAAADFALEALSPFEMAHRGARDANSALRHINETLEAQAKRIAHQLHDEAGQLLASVYLALHEAARDLPPSASARLREVRPLLDQIEGQLRRLSHELRPTILDDLGLLPALQFLAEGVSQRAGIAVSVKGGTNGRLPPAVETALYRVVQETLNNAARHARASRVTVSLHRADDRISCIVRDDGVGLEPEAALAGRHGLGLIGLRERIAPLAGTLEIHPGEDRGTEVLVTIPLEAAYAGADPTGR